MGMHVSDYMFSIQHGSILKEINIAKSNALAFGNASVEITTKNKNFHFNSTPYIYICIYIYIFIYIMCGPHIIVI